MLTEILLITALPAALSSELISKWLDWRSITLLEKATCNRRQHMKLMDCLCDEQTIFATFPRLSKDTELIFMHWIVKRRVKVAELVISDKFSLQDELCLLFLSIQSAHVHSLTIKLLESALFEDVISILSGFPRLRSIRILKSHALQGINQILQAVAPRLEKLHLYKSNLLLCSNFGDVCFPLMSDLYMEDCTHVSIPAVERLCASMHRPTKMILGEELSNTAVSNLVGRCSKLEMISFSLCPLLSDIALAPFLAQCSALVTCDICMNARVGDKSVLALVQNCTQLRALAIGGSKTITNASAVAIAQHCGSRLRVLHLGRNMAITDEGLQALSERCTAVETLLFSAHGLAITSAGIAAWVGRCPGLKDLDISANTDAPPILAAVQQHCHQLRHLNVYGATGLLPARILIAALKLPLLRTLCLAVADNLDKEHLHLLPKHVNVVNECLIMPYWAKYSYASTKEQDW